MKKILCFVLALIMMLGVVGCGPKVDVEGVWLTNDDDNQCGYEFDSLGKNSAGERGGSVSVLPKRTSFSVIFYNYRIGEDNEIIITESAPSFAGNSVGMDEAEYDVLTLETEDEKRVLISSKTGDKYYFTENAE